jgi:hypothetical protein
LTASLEDLTEINVSWSPTAGASDYIVQRSADASNWSSLTTTDTATSYSDVNLNYLTTYYYRVLAASSAGVSPGSALVSVVTGAQPDVLTGQALVLTPKRKTPFTAAVATFTDVNASTTAGQFVATINWGDGTVTVGTITGGAGAFTVMGRHAYQKAGVYAVRVTVGMSVPDIATSAVTSSAEVGLTAKHVLHRQSLPAAHRATKVKSKPALKRHR